jgi:hypothetical protein
LSSNAPELPESGWHVLWDDAARRFIARHPANHLEHGGLVADWILKVRQEGPPPDRMEVREDLYISSVGAHLIAEYLVVPAEYLVIVKDFLPAS